jgi:hypothetical protein
MSQIQSNPQALTGTIIDTPAQRIVAALFEQRADALKAQSSLEGQGFTQENIYVFAPNEAHAGTVETERIVPRLTALGIPEDVASYYQVDVHAGMTLVIVVANERSQDVLNFLRGQGAEGMDQATEQAVESL